jgi:hypothetical protein
VNFGHIRLPSSTVAPVTFIIGRPIEPAFHPPSLISP